MKYITKPSDVYKTKEFLQVKEIIKAERTNEDGEILCEMCGKPIYSSYDMICHHKEEITTENMNNPSVTINKSNLQLVHRKCHDEHHNRFSVIQRKTIFVHGNICSGKTSYVRSIATSNDLIVDMDSIWQMISNCRRYEKPNRLKSVVFAVRECLYDQVRNARMQNGWINTYIISSEARAMERKRLYQKLGVDEVIHIDTPMETCLERLYNDDERKHVISENEKYIREYAERYQDDE